MDIMEPMTCPDCGAYLSMDEDHTDRDCGEVQARQEYEDLIPARVPDYDNSVGF